MNDIVERLRGWEPDCFPPKMLADVREAADEIERLRARLEETTVKLASAYAANDRLINESGNLRAELGDALTALNTVFMVSLPPHDVSCTSMWNNAKHTFHELRSRYRPAPLSN